MTKELTGSFYVVIPQREQVLEVVEHYDGYPIGKRLINLSYVSYKSCNIGNKRVGAIMGKMIPERPLEKMTRKETINELMEHIYGANAKKVPFITICA